MDDSERSKLAEQWRANEAEILRLSPNADRRKALEAAQEEIEFRMAEDHRERREAEP